MPRGPPSHVGVLRGDADDLPEPERDDCQVVATQAQRRRAEDQAGEHRREDREWQHGPEVPGSRGADVSTPIVYAPMAKKAT